MNKRFYINQTKFCLKAISAVLFVHPIAQVFRSLKPQGLRVLIPPEA